MNKLHDFLLKTSNPAAVVVDLFDRVQEKVKNVWKYSFSSIYNNTMTQDGCP